MDVSGYNPPGEREGWRGTPAPHVARELRGAAGAQGMQLLCRAYRGFQGEVRA